MKFHFCIFFLFYLTISVNGQWAVRYNELNSNDDAVGMAVDGMGNVYVTGTSMGNGTSNDLTTVKYNSSGIQQWSQRYNGPGNSADEASGIAVDGIGNVYVTGYMYGPTTGYVTIKYNNSGVQQWVQTYNGQLTNQYDRAYSICIDGMGNVYVTGSSRKGNYFDYATIKYNFGGVQQWVRRYDAGYDDNATEVCVDNFGNVYVTGNCRSTNPSFMYATVKYNSIGVEQWVRNYNGIGSGANFPAAMAVDGYGNIYVTGSSTGSGTSDDYATVKYNSSGVQQWAKRYNGPGNSGDYPRSIAVDGLGNAIVTGVSYGNGTREDYTTIKYSSSGIQSWVKRYNGSSNFYDEAKSVVLDDVGNVYVTGRSTILGAYIDYATIKYSPSGVQKWVKTYNYYYDEAVAVVVDDLRNVYVTGSSSNGMNNDFATVKYPTDGGSYLNISLIPQGLYNENLNLLQRSDTVTIYLANINPPFNIVDSSVSTIDTISFNGLFEFNNAPSGTYYLRVKHFNSIETWSKSGGEVFTSSTPVNYDFTNFQSQAYGNNMILKGTKFCIYSGDVNQDGLVGLDDLILISNNASGFNFGYQATDLNGDNYTDLTDLIIALNNATGFVTKITP